MKDVAFLLADVWLVVVGYWYGWRFIRRYGNWLLGIEWLVVATSSVNFLVWSLLGGNSQSPLLDLAAFLDAFSRSVGITLILVLGMMVTTHRYHPTWTLDVAVFALGGGAALYLARFFGEELHVAPAVLYVVANLLTGVFMLYVARRVWDTGRPRTAVWTGVVTVAAAIVALLYDFFPLPFDDANHTYFYTAALTTWGAQGFIYFHAYRALDDHRAANAHTSREPVS